MHGEEIGVPDNFSILDRDDARSLLTALIAEFELEYGKQSKDAPGKDVLLRVYALAANRGQCWHEVLTADAAEFCAHETFVTTVLQQYCERKRIEGVLDFEDLLTSVVRLLEESEEVCGEVQTMFDYVLVDEFQDTNFVQGQLLDLLIASHRNICAVGDDAQSIYRFRGATLDNMAAFSATYPEARVFRLEHNYRSTASILTAANHCLLKDAVRYPKTLQPVRDDGILPRLVRCPTPGMQADYICDMIENALHNGRSPADVAVLYRSQWHSLLIQIGLRKRFIAFEVRGGVSFFEQAHVKDVMAPLRILMNPWDESAWYRLLKLVRGVGEKTAFRVWQQLQTAAEPLRYILTDLKGRVGRGKEARENAARLFETLTEVSQVRLEPSTAIQVFMDGFYSEVLHQTYDDAEERLLEIQELQRAADISTSLHEFVTEAALTTDRFAQPEQPPSAADESIVLSTVHQAKGLEWAMVLIPWVVEGQIPGLREKTTDEDIAEECRIFHVALTRACDELVLVMPAVQRQRTGEERGLLPSRFLENATMAFQYQEFDHAHGVDHHEYFDSEDEEMNREDSAENDPDIIKYSTDSEETWGHSFDSADSEYTYEPCGD
jgi:DNA helicase-2/ATP-dependent DNA helicase PcrA